MKRDRTRATPSSGTLISGLFAALLAHGLAAAPSAPQQPDVPDVVVPDLGDGIQAEMVELFGKVERQLRRIDALLADAGSGRPRRLGEVKAAGIDELLRNSLETGRGTIVDIDRILELARQLARQQSEGSSGSCEQSGESAGSSGEPSPLDRGRQTAGRERTPEAPGQGEREREGERQRPEGEDPRGDDPKSPLAGAQQDPQNRAAGDPPPLTTGDPSHPQHAGERWGDLPVHVQDMFRTEGDRHVPARYRDWIDAYYRRLAASDRRR